MKNLVILSAWTGLFCLSLVTNSAEAKGRRPKLPDLLLRNFINIGQVGEASADTVTEGNGRQRRGKPADINMTEIDEILREKYGLLNTTSKQGSAKFMLEVYRKLEEGESLARASGHRELDVAILQADTVRSYPTKGPVRREGDKLEMSFRLDGISEEEITKRAELRVRALPSGGRRVFKVKVTVVEAGLQVQRLSYRVRSKRSAKDGSAVIDLTTIVQDVLDTGHRHATLQFTLRPAHSRRHQLQRDSQQEATSNSDQTQTRYKRDVPKSPMDALLVIFTKNKEFFSKFSASILDKVNELQRTTPGADREADAQHHRGKRETDKKEKTAKPHRVGGQCNKLDFTIDFEVIGWDKWIVYPKKFNAYRCGGKCKHTMDPAVWPTNHAILQSLMNRRDRKLAPRPCCVPTKLRPISMLYFEEEEIIVRQHANMVVDKCGCS